ncbi:alpha/beta hydrolase [Rhodopila globiformis]|uniref:Esterase n=1 Tax=Rhodopila globiformis TaxID=1071 RepID=A0A2S6NMY1_RHOGL|nr:alpha/beta hydrolase [Rhodopila globiformis]PPQ37895.1 esterase [Rhodopila globiformis]
MMASKQSEQLDTLYKSWIAALGANPEMPLDELRAMFEHWGDVTAEPGGVDYIEVDAGGVPALWATPKGCAQDRVLLCAHGGGYVCGSMYTHRKVYGHFAKAIGCRALIVHYRRAPDHVHPAPVDDMARAYKWLLDQGIAPKHIALTGDSAGGGLAITTLLRAREQGLPMPAATIPLSPWLDMDGTGATFETNKEKDVLVMREIIQNMAATFLGEKGNKQDPLANPLRGDLRGLPPVYIQVGGYETLLSDSQNLAEAVRRADGDVKIDVYPEMQHVFQFLAGTAPEADKAVQDIAAWVKPKLGLK